MKEIKNAIVQLYGQSLAWLATILTAWPLIIVAAVLVKYIWKSILWIWQL